MMRKTMIIFTNMQRNSVFVENNIWIIVTFTPQALWPDFPTAQQQNKQQYKYFISFIKNLSTTGNKKTGNKSTSK